MTDAAYKIDPRTTLWVTDAELIRRSGVPERNGPPPHYCGRGYLCPRHKMTSAHLDLLIEAGDMPAGGNYPDGEQWYRRDFQHRLSIIGHTLYFVRMGEAMKIGITGRIQDRLRGFETSLPYPVELILAIKGYRAEKVVHAKFADIRLRGEWFKDSPELRAYIETLRWQE